VERWHAVRARPSIGGFPFANSVQAICYRKNDTVGPSELGACAVCCDCMNSSDNDAAGVLISARCKCTTTCIHGVSWGSHSNSSRLRQKAASISAPWTLTTGPSTWQSHSPPRFVLSAAQMPAASAVGITAGSPGAKGSATAPSPWISSGATSSISCPTAMPRP
jgi:hypothetical protein